MNYEQEIKNVERAISALISLKKVLVSTKKVSDKTLELYELGDHKKAKKYSADLNHKLMHVEILKKNVWKTIQESELEVSQGESTFKPSGFHEYRHE